MSVGGTDNTALDATGRNAVALELTDRRIGGKALAIDPATTTGSNLEEIQGPFPLTV